MFTFDKENYVEVIKAMKSADTTAENKATPWARMTLQALLLRNDDGTSPFTIATMTAALVAAYKPRTSTGKLASTMGALPASPRGRANTMKFINDNLGVAGVRSLVDAFILENSKNTIAELLRDVKAAIKAVTVEEETAIENESPSNEQVQADNPIPMIALVNPSHALASMADYIKGLSYADATANEGALGDIVAAIAAIMEAPAIDQAQAA